MSLKAMAWAWSCEQDLDDPFELLVLLALADYANDKHLCWPGYETLKRKTLIKSDSTISNRLQRLYDKELIYKERRPNLLNGGSTSNIYRLNVDNTGIGKIRGTSLDRVSETLSDEVPETPPDKVSETPPDEAPILQQMKFPSYLNQSVKNQLDISNELTTTPKTRSKPDYSDDFEVLWSLKPEREGGNPKKTAFTAWKARIREGCTPEQMIAGVTRYQHYCEQRGNLGTPYVYQMKTFLGPDRHFENSWGINNENIIRYRSCQERYSSIEDELNERFL